MDKFTLTTSLMNKWQKGAQGGGGEWADLASLIYGLLIGGGYVPHSFLIDRIEWSTTNVLCNVPPMQTFPQPLRPDITALVDWA